MADDAVYTSLEDGPAPIVTSASSSPETSKKRRRYALSSLVALAVIAVVAAVAATQAGGGGGSGGAGGAQVRADNRQTDKMYHAIRSHGSTVPLDDDVLGGPETAHAVRAALGGDAFAIEGAEATMVDDVAERAVVVVRGRASRAVEGLGSSSLAELHVHSHEGVARASLRLFPAPASKAAADAAGALPSAEPLPDLSQMHPVPLSQLVPGNPQIARYYKGVVVQNATLLVASTNHTDPLTNETAPAGLSLRALANLKDSTARSLDVCRQLRDLLPGAAAQFRIGGPVGVGSVDVVAESDDAAGFPLGGHVSVNNISVSVVPGAHRVAVSAVLTVSPPGASPLAVNVSGLAQLGDSTKVLHLAGQQIGEWDLPAAGRVRGLVLDRGYAALTVELNKPQPAPTPPLPPGPAPGANSTAPGALPPLPVAGPPAPVPPAPSGLPPAPDACATAGPSVGHARVCGAVGIGLRVGPKIGAFGMIQVPAVSPAGAPEGSFAFEAEFTDSWRVADMPAVSGEASFPEVLVLKSAMVVTDFVGQYSFAGAYAPVDTMQVVKGLNLAARLDGNSTGLAPVGALADGDGLLHVLAEGFVSSAGQFRLAAQLSGLDVGTADVALVSANVTVASAAPYVQLGAEALLGRRVAGDHPALFSVAGAVGGDGDPLTLRGALVSPWPVHLAARNATVRVATIEYTHRFAASATLPRNEFHVRGDVDVGEGATGDVRIRADYPGETRGLLRCFALQVTDDRNTTLGTAMRRYGPDSADPTKVEDQFGENAPGNALRDILHSQLDSVQLYASPYCGNMSLTAQFVSSTYGTASVGVILDRACGGEASAQTCPPPAPVTPPAPSEESSAAEPSSPDERLALSVAATDPHCNDRPGARCHGAWQWHAFAVTDEEFDFSASDFWQRGLPQVELREVMVVVSSEDMTVRVPMLRPVTVQNPNGNNVPGGDLGRVPTVLVDAVRGVNLHAALLLNRTSNMRFVRALAPVGAEEVAVDGAFSSGGRLEACAKLEDAQPAPASPASGGIVIDARLNVTLDNAQLCLSNRNGLSLAGDVGVPLRHSGVPGDRLLFSVEGDLKEGKVDFSGSVRDGDSSLSIPVGHTDLRIDDLDAAVTVTWGDSQPHSVTTASVEGDLEAGNATITMRLDLLGAGNGVRFTGTLKDDHKLPLNAMVQKFSGSGIGDDLPLPSSLAHKIRDQWQFDTLQLTLATSPFSVQGSGSMTVFGTDPLRVSVSVARGAAGGASTTFAMGVELGLDSLFSDVIGGVRALDAMPFADMLVAVSSAPVSMQFPGRAKPFAAQRGFNFFASLALANGTEGLRAIHKWTGADTAEVRGAIADEDHMELHADVAGNMRVGSRVDVTAGGLFVRVNGAVVAVGVEADADIQVTHRASDDLSFHGDFAVATAGLEFDVAMTRPWVNPLGVRGVTVSATDLSLGVSWALVPYQVGVAGGIHIGDVGGDMQVWLSETAQMLYAELDDINLQTIVDHLLADMGVHSPPHLVQVVTDISLHKALLYANTSPQPLEFFNRTYLPGFLFEVDKLDLWELIKGSAVVSAGEHHLLVNATLEPISLLGGEIVVSGAESASDPATFFVSLGGDQPAAVSVSGGVDLFGQHLATEVILSDSEMLLYVDMSLVHHLLNFELNATSVGPAKHPTDFSVLAALSNELQDYIEVEVPKRVDAAKKKTDSDLEDHRADLKAKKEALDSITHKIAEIKAADAGKLAHDEQRLHDARSSLAHAKSHVDSLQNKIHDIESKMHHLKWYQKWKDVGYAAEIAALEAAKVTADGVLDLAEAAVSVAEKALKVLPAADPRVLALETERGVRHAAYDAASALLKATEDVYNGIMTMIEDIAKIQGKIFNIEEASFSASLAALKHGKIASLHLKGVFAGHHVDFTCDIDVTDVLSYVEAVFKEVIHFFKHL